LIKSSATKTAIITGAGSGIGKQASIYLANHGIKTFLIDLDSAKGQSTSDYIIRNGGESFFENADVSNSEQMKKAVDKCIDLYEKLDIGVNSAGIAGARALTHSYSLNDWNKLIQINLTGVFISMKYQIAEMLANKSGTIVNISSIAGIVGLPNASAYVAAKHAVIGITKTAALEYAKSGISINAISPGWTRTDLIQDMINDVSKEKSISSRHPTDRLVEPEEIAQTILWLCTKAPRSMTGTVLPIDGGFTAK
tara:strand:+ start:667 stop:1425 length:759 start_codon:yes stop_codon:yes gene_type:complete